VLVNQTADANFAQNDEVDVTSILWSSGSDYSQVPSTYGNATTLGMRPSWTTYPPALRNSSGAITNLTAVNWKLRAYAWRGW
jgi:hypothetical protein